MFAVTSQSLSIWICMSIVFALHCEVIALQFSSSFSADSSPTRLSRGVAKAVTRFQEFARKNNSTLVVDGNNEKEWEAAIRSNTKMLFFEKFVLLIYINQTEASKSY